MSTNEKTDIESITLKMNVLAYGETDHPPVKMLRLGVDPGIFIEPLDHIEEDSGAVTLEARMYLSDCPAEVAASLLRMAADTLDEALANGKIKAGSDD